MSPRNKKFLSYYKPYLKLFLSVMACALVAAATTLLLPLCTRHITKTILESSLPDALHQITLTGALMLALILIQMLCGFHVDYRGHAMGAMMESDMRSDLFDHLQKLSFRFYDERRTGELMSRITGDLLSLAELYHHGPEDYVINSIKFVGAFVILARIDLRLSVVVYLFFPVLGALIYVLNKRMGRALRAARERIADVNAQVEDSLSGIRVVKSFAGEAEESAKFARMNRLFLESRKNGYKNEAYFTSGVGLLTQCILAAVVVAGGVSIVQARLDLADLLTFLLYIGFLIEPIQKLTWMVQQYQEGRTGFDRFMEIMEVEPDIHDEPGAISLRDVRGDIRFESVGFRYRDGQGDVLKGLSLEVKAGETVALVGTSGVGKTTLCSLIPRFYEATEGCVLLDGMDIRGITLDSLRRSIGVVQQDVYLFAGTVLENIRYGKPGASLTEIVEAAKMAHAHDFIMALPAGYDTDIGQRGVKLSGGQKQRLSIARVFLKDPPILILDEATSSLDNESEKAVQDSLEALAQNRTTFIIAHRLSTIRNAKRIVVLTGQGIEEQGSHEELLALGGNYARLYRMQFQTDSDWSTTIG